MTDSQKNLSPALVDEKLSLQAFYHFSGNLAGFPFVKVVVDKEKGQIHFMNHACYRYHADYIAKEILNMPMDKLFASLDDFNQSIYLDPNRRFYVGIIALHKSEEGRFFTLETVEVDDMNAGMLTFFYRRVKDYLDPSVPLLFKPANHSQETIMAELDPADLPRVYNHQLFQSVRYICLHPGDTKGRLRAFSSLKDYQAEKQTIEWHDIIVMPRVPDDITRVSGIINAEFTTPLSHTNVLASGWQIPNAVQIGILDR
ncbi:MAG: phosphoenolpyruvate synthase, partial [Deltaproteobacteria bacterium]|nr:phosphoenolpyruvate synthase [Deltaproteobacteria bacterium]